MAPLKRWTRAAGEDATSPPVNQKQEREATIYTSLPKCCLVRWLVTIRQHHKSVHLSCLVSGKAAGGGNLLLWGMFSWYTLGSKVPVEHRSNATANLSIVADKVLPFLTTVDRLLMDTSSKIMHQVTKLKSKILNWLLKSDNEFPVLQQTQSADLNPAEQLWDVANERVASWMCSCWICRKCTMLSCQYAAKSPGNVSNTVMKVSN